MSDKPQLFGDYLKRKASFNVFEVLLSATREFNCMNRAVEAIKYVFYTRIVPIHHNSFTAILKNIDFNVSQEQNVLLRLYMTPDIRREIIQDDTPIRLTNALTEPVSMTMKTNQLHVDINMNSAILIRIDRIKDL